MIAWIRNVLERHDNETRDGTKNRTQSPNGRWRDAKPLSGPWSWEWRRRLKDIILIIAGRARVVRWY